MSRYRFNNKKKNEKKRERECGTQKKTELANTHCYVCSRGGNLNNVNVDTGIPTMHENQVIQLWGYGFTYAFTADYVLAWQ